MNKNYIADKKVIESILTGKVVINCKTKEEAKAFIAYVNKKGFDWVNGGSKTNWDKWTESTCYYLNRDKTISYHCKDNFVSDRYEVISFKDLFVSCVKS